MADEVKEAPVEQTASEQAAPEGAAPGQAAAAKKNKKINRLSEKDLAGKIEALESSNATDSKYYRHLLQRKKELAG